MFLSASMSRQQFARLAAHELIHIHSNPGNFPCPIICNTHTSCGFFWGWSGSRQHCKNGLIFWLFHYQKSENKNKFCCFSVPPLISISYMIYNPFSILLINNGDIWHHMVWSRPMFSRLSWPKTQENYKSYEPEWLLGTYTYTSQKACQSVLHFAFQLGLGHLSP